MEARPIRILMVEDNPADIDLTKEALSEGKMHLEVFSVEDGVQAMEFLRNEGDHADAPRPDLILLDLNLPRMDGREVLTAVKSDPDLKRIPVVVLTTSKAEEDIVTAYSEHANCYVRKPVQFDEFMKVVHAIQEFWFSIVILPQN